MTTIFILWVLIGNGAATQGHEVARYTSEAKCEAAAAKLVKQGKDAYCIADPPLAGTLTY
jgi:hypothetical protein